jgi:hypothetical protein
MSSPPRKKGIKTASAKSKGRELQKHICRRILHHFTWLKEGDVESRSMGAQGVDVMMSPLARQTLPLSIEAKKTKATPSRSELEQARSNTYKATAPCVVWCPHGCGYQKSMILFDLEEFLNWYKDIAEDKLRKLGEAGEPYAKTDQDSEEC